MSNNSKNFLRPEYMKNYTTKVKHRDILVQVGNIPKNDIEQIVKSANSIANQIIQNLNLAIEDRQIPYITLTIFYKDTLNDKTRIVLLAPGSEKLFDDYIKKQTDILGQTSSHLVEVLPAPGYKDIDISPINCDAEFVVAKEFIEPAIVDMLVDIAMFNSFSFLKELTINEKHQFSAKKYNYYVAHNLGSFYNYRNEHNRYYSFAFAARLNENDIDIDRYIMLWNDFIKIEYGNCTHTEKTVLAQLRQHKDFGSLPKNLPSKLRKKDKGAYLVLRTNKDRTEQLSPEICTYFGMKKYRQGKIKIEPISNFQKYVKLFINLDVSVFKIVVS
mgnify:CR=1 FL=1